MNNRFVVTCAIVAATLLPRPASAQQVSPAAAARPEVQQSNVPAAAQEVTADVEETAKRFGFGVKGGVALDPELIDFGAHVSFGPIFAPEFSFRPGIEFGVGEVTTVFGINADVLYTLPGATRQTRWLPYVGLGPNFALSHQSFQADVPTDSGTSTNTTSTVSRFNFSDTNFETGLNFVAGVRSRKGLFFEMNATAYGVANIRLLGGYNF